MGADDDVDLPFRERALDRLALLRGLKARKTRGLDGKVCKPRTHGVVVLLRENRSRHKNRRLLSVLHALKARPQRHFRLAVAHVPAEQAVHRARVFHIRLNLFNALLLVGREFIREPLFERPLPRGIFGERKAFGARTLGIERGKIDGKLLCGVLGAVDAVCPLRSAELAQLGSRVLVPTADILLHAIELVGRNIQPVAPAVFD
ncbi:hypothetical protein SDC9_69379 [bioreactor metagenome]|uniref:Uncharacterized protein n=1 Tax=bioreactor metagenome TaxID=1076179 RepID=A0A644Y3J9_9ZZZZ